MRNQTKLRKATLTCVFGQTLSDQMSVLFVSPARVARCVELCDELRSILRNDPQNKLRLSPQAKLLDRPSVCLFVFLLRIAKEFDSGQQNCQNSTFVERNEKSVEVSPIVKTSNCGERAETCRAIVAMIESLFRSPLAEVKPKN